MFCCVAVVILLPLPRMGSMLYGPSRRRRRHQGCRLSLSLYIYIRLHILEEIPARSAFQVAPEAVPAATARSSNADTPLVFACSASEYVRGGWMGTYSYNVRVISIHRRGHILLGRRMLVCCGRRRRHCH